ncbi:AfsR/SARP family transcriptional regulator [Pseudarthrobacter albicanus]|uniref:AfsR/SARP family transcriptional regulator n=1 Tax=Pseudarthrobacter albicanus TaxID=2823873 RepID=UPI001BAE0A3B|nr:BTAD domain-containing putative transcriptional regulator [Pseudarthrobacter albicanus]
MTSNSKMRILELELFQLAITLDLGVPMVSGGYCLFQLSLFQSWKLCRDSCTVHVAARQQRLITALAIHGPRPRSFLVGLLWPENSESRAMESLRVCVHLICKQVPGLLVNGGAVLSLSDLVAVDLHRVRAQIRELGQLGLNGNAASYLNLLRDAELLPGWYDDWVLSEQARLRQERLHAFQIIARESLAQCNYEVALEASEAALELEPLYESAVGLLIQAERQQGNNASALQAFEKYQIKLKEDVGIAPSEAIRRLIADGS